MRRYLLWGAAASFALLFIALTTVPAKLLPLMLGEELQLSGVSGTLWRGNAARARVMTSGGALHLGGLSWSLRGLSLLTLSPEVDLRSAWGRQRVTVTARRSGNGVLLRNLDATLNASLVSSLLPVNAAGRISLLFDTLELRDGMPVAADGRLVWEDAGWRSNTGRHNLGSYAAEASTGDAGEIAATIRTIRGPVIADGDVTLRAGSYELQAQISSQESLHPELTRALSLIASPGESGYLLRLEGELLASP